ncbi:MAG: hypothetical protein M1814_002374 [Vezdaea aestivalis]|nr:MAG: hypothetical protein M1814_002374 [Vezdaea aestivalis]
MLFTKTILISALAAFAAAQASLPDSIQAVLLTAVPPASLAALANPSSLASVQSDFAAGKIPSWFSGLPDSVKQYLITSARGAGSSAVSAATSAASAAGSAASSAVSSASSAASSASSAASAAAGSATKTSNPASKPTGALLAAGAGAAGVLALAIGL